MPRRGALITQADVARAIRAAKQAGADKVEIRPDGTIVVVITRAGEETEVAVDLRPEIIL